MQLWLNKKHYPFTLFKKSYNYYLICPDTNNNNVFFSSLQGCVNARLTAVSVNKHVLIGEEDQGQQILIELLK